MKGAGALAGVPVLAAAMVAAPAPAADGDAARREAQADDLVEILDAEPGNALALEGLERLAEVCLEKADLRTGKFVAAQLVRLRPDRMANRYRYVSFLLARGERATAEKELRELLRERPSLMNAHVMLAAILEEDGRLQDCLDALDGLLREHPLDGAAMFRRGWIHVWRLKDLEAARGDLDRMRSAAKDPKAHRELVLWLEVNVGVLEKQITRLEKERGAIGESEARLDLLLGASLAGFAVALAGAFWLLRERPPQA